MTLSGVLKDILLVMASMVFFRDPVAPMQYFGYSIALGGLMYYKLGGEKFQNAVTDVRLSLAGFRQKHPARAKAVAATISLVAISLTLWVWWPFVPK